MATRIGTAASAACCGAVAKTGQLEKNTRRKPNRMALRRLVHDCETGPCELNLSIAPLAGVYCESESRTYKSMIVRWLFCGSCITHVGYYRADRDQVPARVFVA